MAMDEMILVANPGSASRKYALFDDEKCLAKVHFEFVNKKVVYTCELPDQETEVDNPAGIVHLTFAATKLIEILQQHQLIPDKTAVTKIAMRIVAPSTDFQSDVLLDAKQTAKLAELEDRAPLHISAVLQEFHIIRSAFPKAKIFGVSDSAFHAEAPEYAKRYALQSELVERFDLKRFGYHGLSVEATVNTLKEADKLPKRLVVCHLGSGVSVTAVKNGRSIDNSMGYSPLEGLMMATRSGTVDVTVAQLLKKELKFTDEKLQELLNNQGGLFGVSGKSSDIRELLKLEDKDKHAALALDMYAYKVQQMIGEMAAALGGVDALVFTGTVGERSSEMRKRIIKKLMFLGLMLDAQANHKCQNPTELTQISESRHPAKVFIVPTDEASVMAQHAQQMS